MTKKYKNWTLIGLLLAFNFFSVYAQAEVTCVVSCNEVVNFAIASQDESPPDATDGGHECVYTSTPDKSRQIKFGDGKEGVLWKKSDHGDNYVLLLPGWYGRASSVELCGNSQRCVALTSTGGANPDLEGCRDHWRLYNSRPKVGKSPYLKIDNQVVYLPGRLKDRHD